MNFQTFTSYMTDSVTESQGNSQTGMYFLIVAPIYGYARYISHIKKRRRIWGIIFIGCEDYMTMWNAVWKSPWLPSVGSMCYVIYFSGTWKQSLDQGEPGLLPWIVLESDLASTQRGLALSNSSSQADAPFTSFGSEVTFSCSPLRAAVHFCILFASPYLKRQVCMWGLCVF